MYVCICVYVHICINVYAYIQHARTVKKKGEKKVKKKQQHSRLRSAIWG